MTRIAELWREHQVAPFPSGCRGEEIGGIDLVLIDSTTAGCVSTFLALSRKLDPWRLCVLGLCYHDLAVVVAGLEGEARAYFARLEELASLVLCAVRDASKQVGE